MGYIRERYIVYPWSLPNLQHVQFQSEKGVACNRRALCLPNSQAVQSLRVGFWNLAIANLFVLSLSRTRSSFQRQEWSCIFTCEPTRVQEFLPFLNVDLHCSSHKSRKKKTMTLKFQENQDNIHRPTIPLQIYSKRLKCSKMQQLNATIFTCPSALMSPGHAIAISSKKNLLLNIFKWSLWSLLWS